jgi:hypothetical protein
MLSCRVFLLEIYRISRDRAWITGNPEVISSPVGLVPTNALVLTDLATFRVIGKAEDLLSYIPSGTNQTGYRGSRSK